MRVLKLGVATAVVLFTSTFAAQAAIVNFDDQGLTGPSFASDANAGTVSVVAGGDTVTFTNGAVLTNEGSLPADVTSLYYNSFFLPGSAGPAVTVTFSAPISNFFFNLYNGETYAETFTVSDNTGQSTTVTIDSNTAGGVSLISFPAVGSVVTVTTGDLSGYDYSIDNIGFNQATPAVPEPATWAMMLVGCGLIGATMRKRAGVRTTVAYA